MIDEKYFKEKEKECIDKFKAFSDGTELFDLTGETPYKYSADVSGTCKDKTFMIELKNRECVLLPNGNISGHSQTNGKDYVYEGVMIESHKIADLLLDRIDGLIPLYINFFDNGYVALFNIDKLKHRPTKSENINIMSKGYRKFEMSKRQFLNIEDAYIYDSKYNLIKKPGEWKTHIIS